MEEYTTATKKLNLFNEHQRQCDEISNLHTEID
jgi:hypothetical protein